MVYIPVPVSWLINVIYLFTLAIAIDPPVDIDLVGILVSLANVSDVIPETTTADGSPPLDYHTQGMHFKLHCTIYTFQFTNFTIN